jgi:hypothetical protein
MCDIGNPREDRHTYLEYLFGLLIVKEAPRDQQGNKAHQSPFHSHGKQEPVPPIRSLVNPRDQRQLCREIDAKPTKQADSKRWRVGRFRNLIFGHLINLTAQSLPPSSKRDRLPPPIDQFPEFGHLLQHLVLSHGELGAVEEILDRVLVQDAVNEQSRLDALEINPVFLGAIAIQMALLAFELAEFFGVGLVEVLGKEVEFAEDLQLEQLGQMGQFAGAAVVEDDLEHGE